MKLFIYCHRIWHFPRQRHNLSWIYCQYNSPKKDKLNNFSETSGKLYILRNTLCSLYDIKGILELLICWEWAPSWPPSVGRESVRLRVTGQLNMYSSYSGQLTQLFHRFNPCIRPCSHHTNTLSVGQDEITLPVRALWYLITPRLNRLGMLCLILRHTLSHSIHWCQCYRLLLKHDCTDQERSQ